MSAIIAGAIICGAAAAVYVFGRNSLGQRGTFIAMVVVGGILAFVLKGCIFGG
jgi:hypothetical protein